MAARIHKTELHSQKDRLDDPRFIICGFENCMQCGRCTASCPAAYAFGDYLPRLVMNRLALGDTRALAESIWKCGQCYSCRARCPRNNSVGAGVLALREESLRRDLAPGYIKHIASILKKNLYDRGETFLPHMLTPEILAEFGPMTVKRCSGNSDKRLRLGYERDDARACRIPDSSMKEIRHILDATGCGGEHEQ